MRYICTTEYYWAIKKTEIMSFVKENGWHWRPSLSKISQTKKEKHYMFSLICGM
jgi:hypothetical protein